MKKESKINTLKQFRKSRRLISKEQYERRFKDELVTDAKLVLVYGGKKCGLHIEVLDDGRYYLNYERYETTMRDLDEVERLFWKGYAKAALMSKERHMIKAMEANYKAINKEFIEWLESDNVFEAERDVYTTQCSQFRNRLTLMQLREFYVKNYQPKAI